MIALLKTIQVGVNSLVHILYAYGFVERGVFVSTRGVPVKSFGPVSYLNPECLVSSTTESHPILINPLENVITLIDVILNMTVRRKLYLS